MRGSWRCERAFLQGVTLSGEGRHAKFGESQAGLDRGDLAGAGHVVGCLSPNLTKLAAEGQAKMLAGRRREPARGGAGQAVVARSRLMRRWPSRSCTGRSGLTAADRQYALRLSERFEGPSGPSEVVRVLGPASIAGNRPAPGEPGRHGLAGGRLAVDVVRRAGDAGGGRLDGASGDRPASWRSRRDSRSAGRATR